MFRGSRTDGLPSGCKQKIPLSITQPVLARYEQKHQQMTEVTWCQTKNWTAVSRDMPREITRLKKIHSKQNMLVILYNENNISTFILCSSSSYLTSDHEILHIDKHWHWFCHHKYLLVIEAVKVITQCGSRFFAITIMPIKSFTSFTPLSAKTSFLCAFLPSRTPSWVGTIPHRALLEATAEGQPQRLCERKVGTCI